MSKEEYLKQLQKYLKKLPKQDYEDAMEYFIEYFEETDEAGAQELMKELGTPKEAARDLISSPMCVYFWAFILFGRRQTGDSWYFSNSVFNIRICAYKWKWNFFCRSCNS